MKKIMFNDKFGLTDAVLQGRKTMTRRPVGNRMTDDDIKAYLKGYAELANKCAYYKIGEVVAVAQSYKDAGIDPHFLMFQPIDGSTYFAKMEIEAMFTEGWNNKMFVRADLMTHQIRITDIKVERLQDISEEDVYKEGFRKESINNGWGNAAWHWESVLTYMDRLGCYKQIRSENPKEAFSLLIDKVSGVGTWERNPWVFAYSFELCK